jgi:hypothetical protein
MLDVRRREAGITSLQHATAQQCFAAMRLDVGLNLMLMLLAVPPASQQLPCSCNVVQRYRRGEPVQHATGRNRPGPSYSSNATTVTLAMNFNHRK